MYTSAPAPSAQRSLSVAVRATVSAAASKNSMQRGETSVDVRAATTKSSASASRVKGTANPVTLAGSGKSDSSASTMMPSVPSLPMNQSTGSCTG